MPDLGNLLDFDFGGGGDWDYLDALANLGSDVGDLSNMVLDTLTGEMVDISSLSPEDLADLDPVANVPGGPTGTSLSDTLRSREADWDTEGTEPFDWNAMADPSASIASAGSSDWAKALAKGLGSALGGLGSGLKSLAPTPTPGGASLPSAGGLLSAGTPSLSMPSAPSLMAGPGLMGGGDGGGLASLGRLGTPDGVAAALMRGQVDPAKLAMQSAIDAGPAPRPFTPLAIPTAGGALPMAQAPAPRISGLQRLLSERLG